MGLFEIDLTGPDGNVFYLIGMAKKLTKMLNERRGAEYLNWDEIRADMMNADYEHAVAVFEKHFGHITILYR